MREFREVPRIFRSIERKDTAELKRCLKEGDDPNIEHHFKYSPYYEAYGDEKKYLTKKEFDDLGKKYLKTRWKNPLIENTSSLRYSIFLIHQRPWCMQ